MRPPPKVSFVGIVALLFPPCTGSIPPVFARVPLDVESQWAQAFPSVGDGPLGPLGNNELNEQVVADTYPVCCTVRESLVEKTSTVCERVTSEEICDGGTLYDCSGQFETLDIQKKCHVSAYQSPARITDEVIQALPYPLLLCALAGAFLNQGPGYHCLEGL